MTLFWRIIHNAVAHPLLIIETDLTVRFHDWTARKWEESYV